MQLRSDRSQRTGGSLFQGTGAVVQARSNLHHALAVDFQRQLRGLLTDNKRVPAHLLRATKQRIPFLHWPPSRDEIGPLNRIELPPACLRMPSRNFTVDRQVLRFPAASLPRSTWTS